MTSLLDDKQEDSENKQPKYDFKFRLDIENSNNEFMHDNLIFLTIKSVSIEQVVKILNLSLNMPPQIKKPPKFQIFVNPDAKKEI